MVNLRDVPYSDSALILWLVSYPVVTPWDERNIYLYTFTIHFYAIHVGKYSSPMEQMGYNEPLI